MQEFVIDIRLHPEELPDLAVLEGDLQSLTPFLVGERLDLWVVDLDGRNAQGHYKMTAVFDLLLTLSAEHHRRDNLAFYIPNKCTVNQASFI